MNQNPNNLINEDLDISWKASHPIYTYNIRCKVKDYEMNFTQNPSSIKSSDGILKDNVTGSSFNPYVTTVGLYNDSNELLKNYIKSQEYINERAPLILLKTHSSMFNMNNYKFTDLNNSLGVIYIVRDPRNVVTSIKNHFSKNDYTEALKFITNENNYKYFRLK